MYLTVLHALLQAHLVYARFSNSSTLALSSNSTNSIHSSSEQTANSYSGSSTSLSNPYVSVTIVFALATTSSHQDNPSPLSQVPTPSPSDGTSYLANTTSIQSFGLRASSYALPPSAPPETSNETSRGFTATSAASSTSAAHNITHSSVIQPPPSANASLGMSISASTLAGNKTSPASTNTTITPNNTTDWTWAKWSPLAYPADCNAYYTASSASPSATPWSALANAVSLSSAWSCFSSLASYSSVSSAWGASNIIYQLSTRSYVYSLTTETDTIPFTSYQLTTLCDGLPRVVTGLNASSTIGRSTALQTYGDGSTYVQTLTTATSALPFTTPPPTCSLDCKACSMVSAAAYYSSSSHAAAGDQEAAAGVLIPYSCPSPPLPDTDEGGAAECAVMIESAQMYYWPVTVVNGDLCNKTGTTITPTPTGSGPNTMDIGGGITLVRTRLFVTWMDCSMNELCSYPEQLTSPTVYISYFNLSYISRGPNTTESYVTNTLLGFDPMDVSSQRGNHGGSGTYSVNYGDLPPNPVPSSAWFGQVECFNGVSTCLPIGTTVYKPDLVWPPIFSDISSLNPKWTAKSCSLGIEFDGVWDPPSALQPASTVDGPSTPVQTVVPTTSSNKPESTPASPSSTPPSGPVPTTAAASSSSTSFTAIAESTKPVVSGSSVDSSTSQDPTQPAASTLSADSTQVASRTNHVATSKAVSDGPGQPTRSYAPVLAYSESRLDTPGTTITSRDAGGIIASVLDIPRTSSIENASPSQTMPNDPGKADPGTVTTHVPGYSSAPGYATATSLASVTLLTSVHAGAGAVIDGTTFSSGQTLSLGGKAGSVDSTGIVLEGTSMLLSAQATSDSGAADQVVTLTAGGLILTATQNGGGSIAIGQTSLGVGGSAATVSNQAISTAGSGIVVGGSAADVSNDAQETDLPQMVSGSAGRSTLAAMQLAAGIVAVAGNTLLAGGPDMTVGSQTFSAVPSGLVVGGSTVTFSASAMQTAVLIADGSRLTAIKIGSEIIGLGETTLSIGGPEATIGGKTLSAASGGLIVDGSITAFSAKSQGTSTVAFDLHPIMALVTAGSSTYTVVEQSGSAIIAGKTLTIGGPALTLDDNQTLSEASNGLIAVGPQGTSTIAFSPAPRTAIITAGGSTYTAVDDSGSVSIAGKTLTVGGPALTLEDGQIVSEAVGGLVIEGLSGTHSVALQTAIVSADDSAYTALKLGSGTVVLDGKTLTIGGAALTLGSGEGFSEASGGFLAVGPSYTRTMAFQTEHAAIITAQSSTYTAFEIDPGTVVLDGGTLTVGGSAITLGGHIFSEGPTGLIEDGTSTIALTSSPADTISPTISSPVSGDSRPSAPSTSSCLSSRSQLKWLGLWLPLLLFLAGYS
ncbi:hypothetical protein LTR27_005092 [Elasticomyces elasticus]|nr:hypothetical protein LTR27_005092 [Elasticomyces elasticus]